MGKILFGYNRKKEGGSHVKNRIRDLREDADLPQRKVAAAIGITQRKYSYLETGTQPLTADILVRLSGFYGVSVDYLLCLTDDPTPASSQKQN